MNPIRNQALRMGAVAVCSVALFTGSLLAQGGRGMMSPDQRLDAIDKAVTLTTEQKSKVKVLLEDDGKKMQALRDAQDPDMRTKMMDMRKEENEKIKAMLTDEQKPKYDAYVASMPMGRPGGGPPPSPPQQ